MTLKERIIEESAMMFAEQGIKAIRMDDIASHLSISKRTIYELFGDKETLIMDSLSHYHEQEYLQLQASLKDAANIIEEFIILFQNWDTQADKNYRIMSNVRKFYPKIFETYSAQKHNSGIETMKKKLKEGIRQGLFLKHLNLELAIAIFQYAMYGVSSRMETELPSNVSHTEAFKYIIIYFMRGIATEKGIQIIDEKITKKL